MKNLHLLFENLVAKYVSPEDALFSHLSNPEHDLTSDMVFLQGNLQLLDDVLVQAKDVDELTLKTLGFLSTSEVSFSEDLDDELDEYEDLEVTPAVIKKDVADDGKITEPSAQKKSRFLTNLVKKAISLKADDIEKTNKARYRVLRLALAAVAIGGFAFIPMGLVVNLIGTLGAASAVTAYSYKRTIKTKDVLEVQVESLESKLHTIRDEKVLKETKVTIKALNRQIGKLDATLAKFKRQEGY